MAHKLQKNLSIMLTAFVVAFFGCGGNKATKIIMSPDFQKGHPLINADIAVVVLDSDPKIIYLGDVFKSLGSTEVGKRLGRSFTPETLIKEYFYNRLTYDLQRNVDVNSAFLSGVSHPYRITKEMVRTLDEDIAVEIPEAGTRFTFAGHEETALVLFLDKIRLGTDTDPYYLERAEHGVSTTTGRRLICMVAFTLWDNRGNQKISYGRVRVTVPITREEATVANWEELSRNVIRTIFAETGYIKRQR